MDLGASRESRVGDLGPSEVCLDNIAALNRDQIN